MLTPVMEVLHRFDQIALDRAAKTAAHEDDIGLVGGLDEVVIQTDLAELVDDDGRPIHGRVLEPFGKQRRFAAAEKAGDDRCGNRIA